MPATRKRENRENQFYNVGEQGRKTGIRLEDKGVRDEYGMEPVSGIFSSPEKSPPKRSSSSRRTAVTVTESQSMDIQESSIPDLTPGHILRNSRTNLPPPKSRSPMKTALGSSPRRQSSMGPRAQSVNNAGSPGPAVSRRLDFDQEESSLQETPALSGSGARRGLRRNIYELETSPSGTHSAVMEESLQQEITANEDSEIVNGYAEDSFAGAIEDDAIAGASGLDDAIEEEESEVIVAKQPSRRGRKRKSDALESAAEETASAPQRRKRGAATAKPSPAEKEKKPTTKPRGRAAKPKRVSEVTAEEPSTVAGASIDDSVQSEEPSSPVPKKGRGRPARNRVDESIDESVQVDDAPVSKKGRGRPTRNRVDESIDESEQADDAPAPKKGRGRRKAHADTPVDDSEQVEEPTAPFPTKKTRGRQPKTQAANEEPAFKKPKALSKSKAKPADEPVDISKLASGKLVFSTGEALTKTDIEQMSTTSTGSKFGRGRSLSVFRQFGPEEFGNTTRTGRHRLPPVNFWKNEHANYAKDGSLLAVVQPEDVEEQKLSRRKATGKTRGRKRVLATVDEDEEDELEDWEQEDGVLTGVWREFDAVDETTSDDAVEGPIAWADKGIETQRVPGAEFKFVKLGNAGSNSYFSWGCIDLEKDGIKRTKNSRKMHMVFHLIKGAVEVAVNDTIFSIHKGGIWQVPRGSQYSIRNVATGDSRVFFSQAMEVAAQHED